MNRTCIIGGLILSAGLVAFGEPADDVADKIDNIMQEPSAPSPLLGTLGGLKSDALRQPEKLPELTADLPRETTRVVDPYGTNAPNPLFLASLPGKLCGTNRPRLASPSW